MQTDYSEPVTFGQLVAELKKLSPEAVIRMVAGAGFGGPTSGMGGAEPGAIVGVVWPGYCDPATGEQSADDAKNVVVMVPVQQDRFMTDDGNPWAFGGDDNSANILNLATLLGEDSWVQPPDIDSKPLYLLEGVDEKGPDGPVVTKIVPVTGLYVGAAGLAVLLTF